MRSRGMSSPAVRPRFFANSIQKTSGISARTGTCKRARSIFRATFDASFTSLRLPPCLVLGDRLAGSGSLVYSISQVGHARVAELADALDSKSSARKGVPVRLRALVLQELQGFTANLVAEKAGSQKALGNIQVTLATKIGPAAVVRPEALMANCMGWPAAYLIRSPPHVGTLHGRFWDAPSVDSAEEGRRREAGSQEGGVVLLLVPGRETAET